MKWAPRIQDILNLLAAKHPTWVADDSGPPPTPRYRLNEMFVQQVRHEFGPQYGLKRADPSRPISSENLAMQEGSRLIAWAWENRHDGTVDVFPESEDITGQTFVPVDPVDHLGAAPAPVPVPPPVPTPPPVPPPAPDLGPLLARIDKLEKDVKALWIEFANKPPPPWPQYRGRGPFGITIISHVDWPT